MPLIELQNISQILIFCLLSTLGFCNDFKENIIINGNFSNPILTWQKLVFKDYSIMGWSCTRYCEIGNCANFQRQNIKRQKIYNDCQGQVIDLNSINQNQLVTQIIQAKAGTYLLSLNYFFPIYNANKKTLLIYFNGELVFQKLPNVYNQFRKYYFETEVKAFQGLNNLTLTMEGYVDDGSGFNINNVSLKMIYSHSFEKIINDTFQNSALQSMFSVPGQRVLFGQIITVFADLDRLQFYGYHKRKHSHYERIFLENINILMELKGTLLKSFFNNYLIFPSTLNAFFANLNYKSNYTDISFLSFSKSSNSFIDNNSDLFIYSVPNTTILWLIYLFLFRVTYRLKISKMFRKYSLFAVLLFLNFEGNIEQFSFYLFQEFRLFFSSFIEHKLINLVLLHFCFLLLFVSVACFLWLKWHYKQLSSYFTEDYGTKIRGIIGCTLDRGIMCFFFGLVNSIFINYPSQQLIILISLEILWIFIRCYYLSKKSFKAHLFIWIQITSGFNRALFLISCLAFQKWSLSFINDYLHKNILIMFLLIWLVKLLIGIKEIILLINIICNYFNTQKCVLHKKQKCIIKQKSNNDYKLYFKNGEKWILQNRTHSKLMSNQLRNKLQKIPKDI